MNTNSRFWWVALLAICVASACSQTPEKNGPTGGASASTAKSTTAPNGDALRVAVVTGGHPFDVPNFYQLFRELPGIDAYPQHIEHFASSPAETRDAYDVVVFYGMDQGIPEEAGRRAAGNPRAAIERIATRGQGIVVLHHALLAWEKWDFWNQLIGFDNRNFRFKEGLQLNVTIADKSHPATRGLADFEIDDEGYVLKGTYDGQGSVLATVQHKDAMKEVAWARTHEKSRVFCMALGHDDKSWRNPGFRNLLQHGIAWAAGKKTP